MRTELFAEDAAAVAWHHVLKRELLMMRVIPVPLHEALQSFKGCVGCHQRAQHEKHAKKRPGRVSQYALVKTLAQIPGDHLQVLSPQRAPVGLLSRHILLGSPFDLFSFRKSRKASVSSSAIRSGIFDRPRGIAPAARAPRA